MNYQLLLCVLILIGSCQELTGQCLQSKGSVFINEVGNTEVHAYSEYIELVVIGDPNQPENPVDLTNWIIDDSNASYAGVGNEPGHIRLGDCFDAVKPGSIILIYTSRQSPPNGIFIENDGTPNERGVYQLTTSHPCIKRCFETPTQENKTYDLDCSGGITEEGEHLNEDFWDQLIPLRNLGDVVQVRDPNQNLIHVVGWGRTITTSFNEQLLVFKEIENASGTSIQFLRGETWVDSDAYFVEGTGTPGMPNNEDNAYLIDNIANGEFFGGVYHQTCYVCAGGCVSLGATEGGEGWHYAWEPASAVDDPSAPVQELCPETTTTYQLTIRSANGSLIRINNYTVFVNPN